ncbi:MAG TPA: 3-methyl-2-oxobutanoate hydroxymethyltransferase [Nitrososphaeraceae archaeon]
MKISDIVAMKKNRQKIVMLTAYDYCFSKIFDSTNVDIILVGDSASTVMMGYSTTRKIGMKEMMMFCKSVVNGVSRALIVADMPFRSYQISRTKAINNATKFVKCGCDAVKIEGGMEVAGIVKDIVKFGIPVMGHIGLKPQTTTLFDGYKIQGATAEQGMKLIKDAQSLEEAGAFSLVTEKVTQEVASLISRTVKIPVIGIGSGAEVDGQVLVSYDILGIFNEYMPRFIKQYANLTEQIRNAVLQYNSDVRAGLFPSNEHSYHLSNQEEREIHKMLKDK